MPNDFAIFILSYSRPTEIKTINILERGRYTGEWYIVVSTDDPKLEEYKYWWKKRLLIFDKEEVLPHIDIGDNFVDEKKAAIFARNKVWDFAEELGYRYFLQMDDDLNKLLYRYVEDRKLKAIPVTNLDELCEAMVKFLKDSGADCISWGTNAEYYGGVKGFTILNGVKRKAVNAMICDTKKRINFVGRFYDDVNTYLVEGMRGKLFLTILAVETMQKAKVNPGGMSEAYKKFSSFTRAMYPVMYVPSAVKVARLPKTNDIIGQKINWETALPMIISEEYKKR